MLYRVVPFENDQEVCVAAARATSEQVRFEADDDGRDVHVSANCAPRGIPASRAAARWCTGTPLCDGTPCRRFALVVSDEAAFRDAHWRVVDAPTASDPARVLLQPERRTAVDMATVRSVEIEVHDAAGGFKVVHEPESAVVPSHVALWRPFGELRVRRACAALMHHFYGLGQPPTDGHLYALTGVALALQAVAAGSDAEAAVDAEHLGAQLLAVADVGAAVALCQGPAVAPGLLHHIAAAVLMDVDGGDPAETMSRMHFAYKMVADDDAAFPAAW